ncbi:hypothetical protein LCGC14_1011060 [marine sediment metagenome]|uniref:Uncharacterized protein n=1 Tax=marine sediment metagenome TaxID=412755 RepID=A0A0F9N4S4_9ZZZZ
MSRNDNMAFRHAQADNDSLRNRIAALERQLAEAQAENARLQEQVKEAERERKTYWECYQRAFAVYRCMKERADRLQEQVKEREQSLAEAQEEVQRLQMCEGMARDMDADLARYKALAELREKEGEKS